MSVLVPAAAAAAAPHEQTMVLGWANACGSLCWCLNSVEGVFHCIYYTG
jgi:hypothetical protein